MAKLVDGSGKRSASGRTVVGIIPSVPEHLAASNLSRKTIRNHVDNMWVLGGEFIRDVHNNPSLRKKPVDQVLLKMIEYDGPLRYHGGKGQQRSFDSTCSTSSPLRRAPSRLVWKRTVSHLIPGGIHRRNAPLTASSAGTFLGRKSTAPRPAVAAMGSTLSGATKTKGRNPRWPFSCGWRICG
jgi:hypothetical protein